MAYNVPVHSLRRRPALHVRRSRTGRCRASSSSIPTPAQITGTPDTLETQDFEITVTDSCPGTATQNLGITITDVALGRNDTIADATVPAGRRHILGLDQPERGSRTRSSSRTRTTTRSRRLRHRTVTVDINAQINGSPLDSVIEIVDANGVILSTCGARRSREPCQNDDEDIRAGLLDSLAGRAQVAPARRPSTSTSWTLAAMPGPTSSTTS